MSLVEVLDYRIEIDRDGFFATGFAGARLTAPADAVWELVGDWAGQQRLLPDEIVAVEAMGDGTSRGDIRTLTVHPELLPHSVVEVLESYDALRRRYAYALVDTGGTDWARYHGEFEVLATGPDSCLITYVCRFIPLSGGHANAAAEAVSTCETMFRAMAQLLSR
jgi:hypothetical protein